MAESHTGLKHTEEAKRKIGDGNRGKTISPEAIQKQKDSIAIYYETNPGFFTGKSHTDETKKVMSEKTKLRMNSMTPEEKAAYAAVMSKAMTGFKRTPEQRARYSAARSKYMSENPQQFVNSKGEREIAEWLRKRGIPFVQQYQIPGYNHPYDLYVPSINLLIEFDGNHHWFFFWCAPKGTSDEDRDGLMEAQQEKDRLETNIAWDAGYNIIRIFGHVGVDSKLHGSIEEQFERECIDIDCDATFVPTQL